MKMVQQQKMLWLMSFLMLLKTLLATSANVLDMTCINFNPTLDTSSSASYAATLNGADVTSTVSFQRSVDLDTGDRQSTWCSLGDIAAACGLPPGSTIDASGRVTFRDIDQDKFGVYGCQAERYNWTTETSTIFIRNDAHFTPDYFKVTVSLDEEVRLVMRPGSSSGTGSLGWTLNHRDGGQSDLSSSVSGNALYISRAKKEDHAGIHHYYYADDPDRGGLVKLIVRACLDNLWGHDCQYTCPTCYNGGVCDDVSGRCVCPPGFSGDHCEIACEAGKFGQGCSGSCSTLESGRTDCSGAVFCLSDPYGCSCAAGWTGLQCDQACPDGSYGAGCTQTCHCDSSGSCDPRTGACSNGCDDGWIGDQCQVTILDITSILSQGGVYDATDGTNYLGIFMIGDSTVTGDLSLMYYIGREVDTGPGETGHGAYFKVDGLVVTQAWEDTGLPPETQITGLTYNSQQSLRAYIDKTSGGDARVGAYRMSVNFKGWTERNVLLNEYRGDSNSEVWPEKLSYTVGIGETVTLNVLPTQSVDTSSLRWRLNGGNEITEWNGLTSVTIYDVRKSDEGIYECYVEGNRETGKHAILKLIVRSCPSSKYGLHCSRNCPVCYAGGVCHDITGECVCRSGFKGVYCETPCSDNQWGKSCSVVCSSGNPGCPNRLFSPPNPVGLACINGYGGNRCQTACTGDHFGANCELDCNCAGACDRETGCGSMCSDSYEGNYCQALRSDLPCTSGYFGTLCSYPCHCAGDVDCQRSNGHCPNGVTCVEGWAGSDCQQALPRLLESPWVSHGTKDTVLLIWNAWADGYDYGNGPVHSYQIDYTWTDDKNNTGESGVPLIIIGDSTAQITGLLGFRDHDFYVSVRREVEGQVVAGVRSGPINAKPYCRAPQAVDSANVTSDSYNHLEITWSEPFSQCGAPSYNVSRRLLLVDQCDDSMAETLTWEVTGVTSIEYDDILPYSTYEFTVLATLEGYDAETVHVIAYNSTESISTAPPEDLTVDNTVMGKLEYSWSSPPCKDRNGVVSYDYEFGESGGDDVQRENIMMTSKSFEDLQHGVMYEFTVCPRTVVGQGPCIFIQTSTLPSELSTEGIILTCNATHMIVEIPKELLTGDMTGKDVRFGNDNSSDCIGEDKGNDTPGDEFIELTTSLTACGTVMAESTDTETYTNKVINRDEDGISRNYVVDIPLQCSYNRSERVGSVSYELTDYTINKNLIDEGSYTFSFDIYTNGDYDVAEPDYPVNIGLDEELYFAASVLSPDGSLDLSIQSCRATPGTNYNSEPTFEFIQDGCPVEGANAEIRDLEDDSRVGVMLKTVRFIGVDTDLVYIHCNLLVCDDEDDDSICNNDCALGSSEIMGRKRRDVSSKLKTKRFTRGPLRVVRSAQRQGSVLRMDISENGAATQQEVTNSFNPWIVAMAAMATVVMALSALMAVVLRKVNKISAAPAGYKEASARLLDEQEEI